MFLSELSSRFVELMDSERGVQANLSKSINKPSSYFSEIKRGNPVNALHLKAVGIVFGAEKVLELLSIDNENAGGSVDIKALNQIITGIENALAKLKIKKPDPVKKAEFIAMCYEFYSQSGQEVSEEFIERHLRLVA